jgi:hypothetical protein
MKTTLARVYTWVASLGLLAQGGSTLSALLVPALDRAVPALLQQTQMVASHSLLHIATGLVGVATLVFGGTVWPRRFAIGFGLFYVALAVAGERSGESLGLGLKAFDHPFHAVLGSFGLLAAGIDSIRARWAERRMA